MVGTSHRCQLPLFTPLGKDDAVCTRFVAELQNQTTEKTARLRDVPAEGIDAVFLAGDGVAEYAEHGMGSE